MMKLEGYTFVFDMDGTIADLYGVENWLPMLRAEDATPYKVAAPLWDMEQLRVLLNTLRAEGAKVVVTTWLAMGATKAYDSAVREAKIAWLDEQMFPYDEIHLVKYGTTKANCTRKMGGFQVLIDDNDKVRAGWTLGDTVNPTKVNLIKYLESFL